MSTQAGNPFPGVLNKPSKNAECMCVSLSLSLCLSFSLSERDTDRARIDGCCCCRGSNETNQQKRHLSSSTTQRTVIPIGWKNAASHRLYNIRKA